MLVETQDTPRGAARTLKESGSKIDTNVSIPGPLPNLLDSPRDSGCFNLLQPMNNPILVPETHDDSWYTEQERLGPEFQKLSLVFQHVLVVADFS